MTTFATSEGSFGAVELLKRCRTFLPSVIADTEFKTVINTLTLQLEADMIQRFLIAIDNIRSGEQAPE